MGKQVLWSLIDQTEIDRETSFLSEAEQEIFEGFRFDLRRESYLAGRWIAKYVIQKALSLEIPFNEISILNESSGKPYAVINGVPLEGVLSISHAGNWAAAALSIDGPQVGIDVEVITSRPRSFTADYFTPGEFEILDRQTGNIERNVTLIWSAKEATLKAMGLGLRLDTRRVWVESIELPCEGSSEGWNHLCSRTMDGVWAGCWRQIADAVLVCVTDSQNEAEVEWIRV